MSKQTTIHTNTTPTFPPPVLNRTYYCTYLYVLWHVFVRMGMYLVCFGMYFKSVWHTGLRRGMVVLVRIGYVFARILVCFYPYCVIVFMICTYLSVLTFSIMLSQAHIGICIGIYWYIWSMYWYVFVSIWSSRHVLIPGFTPHHL